MSQHSSDASLTPFATAGQHVLLLAEPLAAHTDAACQQLLGGDEIDDTDVLFVSLDRSPDQRLDQLRSDGLIPAKVGIVAVGQSSRSAASSSGESTARDFILRTVSSPGDLTGVGIELNELLSEWSDDGNPTRVCFHSLTTLLQYVELEQVFQFFNVLTTRLRLLGGAAHVHADPSVHDERTLNTVRALFDADAVWTGSTWTVRTH